MLRLSGALRGGVSGGGLAERGAEIFEAAIVLPLVLTIVMALVSLGRGWNIYHTMTRAAREGARQAVTTNCAIYGNTSYSSTDVQNNFVYPALQADGLDTTKVQNYSQGYTWLDTTAPNLVCGIYISFSYPYPSRFPSLPFP